MSKHGCKSETAVRVDGGGEAEIDMFWYLCRLGCRRRRKRMDWRDGLGGDSSVKEVTPTAERGGETSHGPRVAMAND